MFCPNCGKQIKDGSRFCEFCGAPIGVARVTQYSTPVNPDASDKKRLIAALLCWCLGIFGVHRFYAGKVGSGIAMIFTLGGLGIWALIDLIMIFCGNFKDGDGKLITEWI